MQYFYSKTCVHSPTNKMIDDSHARIEQFLALLLSSLTEAVQVEQHSYHCKLLDDLVGRMC